MKKIVIIGAGGHGKVAAEIAEKQYKKVIFLDDNQSIPGVEGAIGDCDRFSDCDFFVAIGQSQTREKICKELISKGYNLVSLVSDSASVSRSASIGRCSLIVSGAVVNACAVIGDGVIVNTCASVDHDCTVGDYSHIAVGSHIGGTVVIGKNVFIGAGVTVVNNLEICDDTTVGAGATVIKSITESGTYVGTPAAKIK